MTIRVIGFRTLLENYRKLNIGYVKLNPLSILSAVRYNKLLATLVSGEFEVVRLSRDHGFEVVQVPRLAWKKVRRSCQKADTIAYGAGALWKLSVHPLKGTITPFPSETYEVPNETLLLTRTGRIGVCSFVPNEFTDIVKEHFNKEHVIYTEHIFRVIHENKDLLKYFGILLNSFMGRLLSDIAWYGALQPELDRKIVERIPIPVAPTHIRNKVVKPLSVAYELEVEAWRAYFKAMKMVEEYLGADVKRVSGTSSYKEIRAYGRLDSKFYVYLNALRRLPSAQILEANELFDVKLGTAPRSRKYKFLKQGKPYISYDAIDDSGFIDEELFYRLPNPPRTTAKARKFSVLLTAVAHSIEGIGKVGVLYPYDDMLCMTGLAILNPSNTKLRTAAQRVNYLKDKTVEDLMLYTFAILKSQLMRRVTQSLTYGLTAQISKKDVENLPIPLIKDLMNSEVANLVKRFVENMYQASVLKRQAVTELENHLLRLQGLTRVDLNGVRDVRRC